VLFLGNHFPFRSTICISKRTLHHHIWLGSLLQPHSTNNPYIPPVFPLSCKLLIPLAWNFFYTLPSSSNTESIYHTYTSYRPYFVQKHSSCISHCSSNIDCSTHTICFSRYIRSLFVPLNPTPTMVNRMEHYPTCSYCCFGISRIFLPCNHKSI
jgi:hypothetical protein